MAHCVLCCGGSRMMMVAISSDRERWFLRWKRDGNKDVVQMFKWNNCSDPILCCWVYGPENVGDDIIYQTARQTYSMDNNAGWRAGSWPLVQGYYWWSGSEIVGSVSSYERWKAVLQMDCSSYGLMIRLNVQGSTWLEAVCWLDCGSCRGGEV